MKKFSLIHKVIATVRDADGNITDRREGVNNITEGDPNSVENGLVFLLMRLFNAQTPTYYDPTDYLQYIELGKGTPSNSGLGTPWSPVKRKTIADADADFDETGGTWYDDPVFVASVKWTAADGAITGITEAGLETSAATPELFAYKTFSPALNKTAGGDLTIEWRMTAAYT